MTEQDRVEFEALQRQNELLRALDGALHLPLRHSDYEGIYYLAARRTQDAKVQALVKAVEKAISAWQSHNFDGTPEAVAVERAMNSCEDIIRQCQLKEQDDEASL